MAPPAPVETSSHPPADGVVMRVSARVPDDDEIDRLAQSVAEMFTSVPPDRRLIIAIGGPPGSGKSTVAYPLTDRLNALLAPGEPARTSTVHPADGTASPDPHAGESPNEVAICVGLDGWHYTRAQLDAFADPADAHWRRGAPDTFDLPSYLAFLHALRAPLIPPPPPIPFPTFDHAAKDPRPAAVPVQAHHRVVVVEGLYTHLDEPRWRDAAQIPDVRVWVDVEFDVARRRVLQRNFEAGLADSLEAMEQRVDAVDMKNLERVVAHRVRADYTLSPVDDPAYVPYIDPRILGDP
ncbi:hypothetical protein Q5752_003610 [Cryptotrichosporon argae]